MAPEQVLGQKLDPRADIYGLGATLYHLITGRPPHQASEREQIYEQVVHAEPIPPRKLNPAIDRDLEAITLKCLEKDPERRYATAGQLAEDLAAYRAGKPVTAKRPMPWQRLYKWARREPVKAGLAGGVILLVLILFLRTAIHNSQLSAALEDAKTAQDKAEKHAATAEKLAEEFKRQREETSQEQKRSADLANILGMRVLSKFKKHEDPQQAVGELKKHADICEALLRKKPLDEIKLDLADTYLNLSNIFLQLQKEEEAASYLDKCIQLQQGLRERYPLLLVEAALNYLDLGGIYGKEGKRLQEMESDHKALGILEELRGKGFANPPILGAMAQAHAMLAIDYFFIKSDRAGGLKHQKEEVAILEQLADAGERGSVTYLSSQTQLAKAYQKLATRLVNPKEAKEALAYFGKARDIFAGKGQYRQNQAEVDLGRGLALVELGQTSEAMAALQQADAVAGQLLGESDDKTGQVRRLVANILSAKARAHYKSGQPGEAEKLYHESLAHRTKVALRPGNETFLLDGYVDLANFYDKEKKTVEAGKHWDEAIRIQESYVAQKPQDFTRRREAGVIWFNKGIFLFNIRDYKSALPCFQEAQTHEIKALDLSKGEASYSDSLFSTYQLIFRAYFNLGNFDPAVKSVSERRKYWSKDREKMWESAKDLAKVFDRSPEHLMVLIDFLDQALADKMIEVNRLRSEPLFDGVRARAEFDKLVQKHAGK
jgi:tetratricopeptide (TPR) repeat protein